MKLRLAGAAVACVLIALPGRAAAEWTLGNSTEGGVATVFLTRSTTYGGAVAFVCDNRSTASEYVLVVTSPFDAVLGRLEVTMAVGAQPPATTPWTATPRDNLLRSRAVIVRDVLAALRAEPGIVFTATDDFGRSYRVEAPVENLNDLVPGFLAGCDALPPPPVRRF